MRLKFSLYPNPFRKQEYMASVQPKGVRTLDDLLEHMATSSRRYTKAELNSVLSLFLDAIHYQLCDGYHIHLPFLKITTSISGKFTDEQDSFDARRHRVNVKVNPGKTLAAIARQIKVKKVEPRRPTPRIGKVLDFGQRRAGVLTPGSPAEVRANTLS